MTTTSAAPTTRPDPLAVTRAIAKRSYCTLATVSDAGVPHVAGVIYAAVGPHLYVSTMRNSRKARNIAATGRAAVCIPIRRLPVGPPSAVQFQATAEVLDTDDPEIARLASDGSLKAITGHGELTLDGGCFVQIDLPKRLVTYGLGLSLLRLIRDPLNAAGSVELPDR